MNTPLCINVVLHTPQGGVLLVYGPIPLKFTQRGIYGINTPIFRCICVSGYAVVLVISFCDWHAVHIAVVIHGRG